MRIEKFFLILALAALVSCQTKDNLKPVNQDFPDEEIVADPQERTSDVRLSFLSESNFDEWAQIGSLEERFDACIPDAEQLEQMTTRALVESIAHFPLNYIVFSYDNPEDAVNLIASESPLHQEFEKRVDAAKVLIDYVADTNIDMNAGPRTVTKGKTLQYCDEIFLEYYMSSARLRETFSQRDTRRFEATVKSKLIERMSEPEVFTTTSLKPLLKEEQPLTKGAYAVAYVHTRFGKRITALRCTELSQYEITTITNNYAANYPAAQVAAPASAVYNCHSYAWYEQSTSNPYWINPMDASNTFQLSKYWTNDYYVECKASETPERAYYLTSSKDHAKDHSAVVRSDGKYISKWGTAPLMIHNPTYCPYNSSNIKKYRRVSTWLPLDRLGLNGPNRVTPGDTQTFTRGGVSGDVTYVWSIKNYAGCPNYQDAVIVEQFYDGVRVKTYSPGAFEIKVEAYAADYPDLPFYYAYRIVGIYPQY